MGQVVQPNAAHFHNGIAHGILDNCSKDVTPERRAEIRDEYRMLLDRAKRITSHKGSGWVSMIEWRDEADSKRAHELNDEMFISGPCPPALVNEALRAIFEG